MTDELYETKLLSVKEYFGYQLKVFGLAHLLSLTDSFYPRILALGYCDNVRKEIVVCKILSYKQRLWHERGHEVGFVHTKKIGHIMHPWGILRGNTGLLEISEKYSERINNNSREA